MFSPAQQQRLSEFKANKKWYRRLCTRAAVAIILHDHPDLGLSCLMIKRASAEGDPWSGQMAFPGGKADIEDDNITLTALRESFEELSIDPQAVKRIARLSDIMARPYKGTQKPMIVSPLVFQTQQAIKPVANYEVASTHWIPLAFFADSDNRKMMDATRHGLNMELPCYDYQSQRVWGLSLMMIDELVDVLQLNTEEAALFQQRSW